LRLANGPILAAIPQAEWRLTMKLHIPVLPVAGGTLVRAMLALVALVTYWLKQIARARRHRRDVRVLAGLDSHMLADIGITRSDLRDAFSGPFWDDPTALLRERALERRLGWPRAARKVPVENGFHRPATNRPARQSI
jgi:uncharacterized protein YjiS (DUF1127 family)